MKIEDILKAIMICIEHNVNIDYYLDNEDLQILLNYIADLQRKEYNNSKAIELLESLIELNGTMTTKGMYKLLNILKGE